MLDNDIPLCVDLDGTLIRTDIGFESALALLRRNPFYLFLCLFWLLRGRAHLKRQIALRTDVDVATLPYNPEVMAWLRGEAAARRRILCTASDQRLADAVAAHVGGFDEVLGSDGHRNLGGRVKAALLCERYGERGFDYAGNAATDLNVWRHARSAIVVGASTSVLRRAREMCGIERVFVRTGGTWRDWLLALRPHQWLKNALVWVPLLAAHLLLDTDAVLHSMIAFVAFSLCASGAYVINDLLDLDADRRHPRKRSRPFASGVLPLWGGLVAAPLLTFAAFAVAALLPGRFLLVLLAYAVITLAYSLVLKRIAMIDVLTLATLYTVRIIGGAAAIPVEASQWLLAFSMFLFLGLALLKRYTEIQRVAAAGQSSVSGRGYVVADLDRIRAMGIGASTISALVLAFYINSTKSAALYAHHQVLWLLLPVLLFWIGRAWLVAHRGRMHDDPVVFALTDRLSLGVLVVFAAVIWCAI